MLWFCCEDVSRASWSLSSEEWDVKDVQNLLAPNSVTRQTLDSNQDTRRTVVMQKHGEEAADACKHLRLIKHTLVFELSYFFGLINSFIKTNSVLLNDSLT